jgi:hypothetical protein
MDAMGSATFAQAAAASVTSMAETASRIQGQGRRVRARMAERARDRNGVDKRTLPNRQQCAG